MKAMKTLIASAVLCSLMPSAFAASTVDMTVGGSIVPAACTPSLSNRRVTFGKVSSTDLAADAHTDLVSQSVTLNIRCTSPTLYGLRTIDNKPGTGHAKPGTDFPMGLGLTPTDEKIGAYHLEIEPEGSQIDGAQPFFGYRMGLGGWSNFGSISAPVPSLGSFPDLVGMQKAAGNPNTPVAIENASLKMSVHGYIAPAAGLTLTDEVALDGAATLEVVYL